MGCLKIAVLTELMRIFSPKGTRGVFFWSCQVLLWINVVVYCSALIIGNLTCTPYERIWDKAVPGTCMNRKNLDISNASFNLVSHIFILALPQRVIWKLNMAKVTKIGVSVVFAIGTFACISAAFRLNATIQYLLSEDATYYVSGMALWCLAEITSVLLVLCVPTIPKVFRDTAILSKIQQSWRSWSLFSARHSRNTSGSEFVDFPSQSQTYRVINGRRGTPKNVHLGRITSSRVTGQWQDHRKDIPQVSVGPRGILRTIDFETAEEAHKTGVTVDGRNYTIPWDHRQT
ncbi:hypothetical protein F4818DRAFT_230005 [Hypoxylon cercidicola]|nr:hypothetical protein F4818DRAFT_230005 [Hypoxylon cercidicola]